MKNIIYTLWQWTWGFLQTLVGAVVYIFYRKNKHYNFHCACVTVWKSKSSLSLGKFIFISDDPFFYYEDKRQEYTFEEFNEQLLVHEYGHTIQSLILGPLYFLVVGVPSIVWSFLPVFVNLRESKKRSYFDVYCEKTANILGEKVTKKKSIGMPVAN